MTGLDQPLLPRPQTPSGQGQTPWDWRKNHPRIAARLDQKRKFQAERTLSNLRAMADVNPEVAGKAHELGLDLDMHPKLVEDNLEKLQELQRWRHESAVLSAQGNEVTLRSMSDPEFARIAREDIESLSFLENMGRQWEAGRLRDEQSLLYEKMRGGVFFSREDQERLDQVTERLETLPTTTYSPNWLAGFGYGASNMLGQMWSTLGEGIAAGTASAGIGLLAGQMGPQAAAPEEVVTVPFTFGRGFMVGMAAGTARREAGASYGEMLELGIPHQTAADVAGWVGLINGALELGPAKALSAPFRREITKRVSARALKEYMEGRLKRGVATNAIRDFAVGVGSEVGTEILQEVVNIAGEEVALGRTDPGDLDMEAIESRPEVWDRLYSIAGEAFRGVFLLGAVGPLAELRSDVARIRAAEQRVDWWGQYRDGAEATTLAKNAPSMLHRFLAQAAPEDRESAWVPVEKVREVMEARGISEAELARTYPKIAERLPEADRTGDIQIPTAELQMLSRSDFGRDLELHARFDPGGLSAFEAQIESREVQERFAKEISATLDEVDDSLAPQIEEIREAVMGQVAEAGRTPIEADALATLYTEFVRLNAEREGVTPREWHSQHGATFQSERGFAAESAADPRQPVTKEATKKAAEAENVPEFDPESPPPPGSVVRNAEGRQGIVVGEGVGGGPVVVWRDTVKSGKPQTLGAWVRRANDVIKGKKPGLPRLKRAAGEQQEQDAASGSKGRFLEDLKRVLLSERADASTLFHELAHFFMVAMEDAVERGTQDAQTAQDFDTLLQWFKIEGATAEERLAAWQALDDAKKEPFQEQLAYNFERYLFEGKAPTKGLEGVFHKIRSWMVRVYRDIVTQLNARYRALFDRDLPGLTDDVRQVFGRMVASQEQIDLTLAERTMRREFQTKEEWLEAGLPEEDWQDYDERAERYHARAVARLTAQTEQNLKWRKGAESRIRKELEEEQAGRRAEVEAQVLEDVQQMPAYATMRELVALPAEEKIQAADVRWLVERLPEEQQEHAREVLGGGPDGVSAAEGMPADAVASRFGFPSGEAMMRALVEARTMDELIDQETTRRLERDHGDLFSEEMLEEAVDRALHNEVRADLLASEAAYIEGLATSYRVLNDAAVQNARAILAGKTLRQVQPYRWSRLEVRAAKEATRARARGDMAAFHAAKRRQLLMHHMTREAYKVRDEFRKLEGIASRLVRSRKDLAKRGDINLIETARVVLGLHGMMPPGAFQDAKAYLEKVQRDEKEAFEAVEPLLERAAAASARLGENTQGLPFARNMTVEQFRGLQEDVTSLLHLASNSNKVLLNGRRMELEEAVGELVVYMDQRHEETGGDLDKPHTGALERPGKDAAFRAWWHSTKAALTRPEVLLRHLDGKQAGLLWLNLYQGVKERIIQSREIEAEKLGKLEAILDHLHAQGAVHNRKIEAPELGYRFSGTMELLGALMHMGNYSNKSKFLVAGRGTGKSWAEIDEHDQITFRRWERTLQQLIQDGEITQAHFDAVQAIWDLNEELKPLLQDAHKEQHGYRFGEVPAQSFTVEFKDGTVKEYRGGYVPAARDPYVDSKANSLKVDLERFDEEHHSGLPKAFDGMTKERIETFRKRPLTMDLQVLQGHIVQSIRYAVVGQAVRNTNRILMNQQFRESADRLSPDLVEGVLIPMLQRAVHQSLYEPGKIRGWDTFWRWVRRNTGVAVMSFNITNIIQQVTGLANLFATVKTRHAIHGLSAYVMHPVQSTQLIDGKSTFMRQRGSNQQMQQAQEIEGLIRQRTLGRKLEDVGQTMAYGPMSWLQNMIDRAGWLGAYDQAIAEGRPEAEAVALADQAVRETQGSFDPEDVASYEVGTPWWRLWTQFSSFFNVMLNKIMYPGDTSARSQLAAIAFFASIPLMMSDAIYRTLMDRWDDEDDDGHLDTVLDMTLGSHLRGAASMTPIAGPQLLAIIEPLVTDTPRFGDRVVSTPAMSMLTRAGTSALQGGGLFDSGEISGREVRDLISAFVLFVPGAQPAAVAGRPAAYLTEGGGEELLDGNFFEFLRGISSGVRDAESRQ